MRSPLHINTFPSPICIACAFGFTMSVDKSIKIGRPTIYNTTQHIQVRILILLLSVLARHAIVLSQRIVIQVRGLATIIEHRHTCSDDVEVPQPNSCAGNVFVKDNVAINANGIAMRNNPKTFTLAYSDLEIGDIIGRGSSSVVIQAYHSPTATPIALKVFNMANKSKRGQLIREICSLYDAHCPGYDRPTD